MVLPCTELQHGLGWKAPKRPWASNPPPRAGAPHTGLEGLWAAPPGYSLGKELVGVLLEQHTDGNRWLCTHLPRSLPASFLLRWLDKIFYVMGCFSVVVVVCFFFVIFFSNRRNV